MMTRRGNRGFTVVELLVATAITAVLAALLITITSGVMDVWNRSRGSLVTSNQVKIALDQIASDLEGAIIRNDGQVWLAATILESSNIAESASSEDLEAQREWIISGSKSARIKPSSDPASSDFDARNLVLDATANDDCRFGRAGVWLRFFTTKRGSNVDAEAASTPVAVSYQFCRRSVRSVGTSEIAYMLYRSVVRSTGSGTAQSGGTFQIGYDLDPDADNAYADANNDSDGNPGTLVRPYPTQMIANHVIDFGVRLYIREGSSYRLIFPAQPSERFASPLTGVASDNVSVSGNAEELSHLVTSNPDLFSSVDAYRRVAPDIVEIVIRVLTDEGAEQIRALESGSLSGNWWDIAEAHSRVYTRRVEIVGGAL